MGFLRRIAGSLRSSPSPARGKEGARAFGIGDIHGRLDLLNALLAQIEAEVAALPKRRNFLVLLGDLIDRGPDSRGVVERLRTYRHEEIRPVFLVGNHEEILLRVLDGEPGLIESWLQFGGAECAASYGVDVGKLARLSEHEGAALLRRHIPPEHISFIEEFADTFRFGDYLFVHAGIRPGIPLEEQRRQDLRWIRDPFLSDTHEHGFLVVHGHTVVEEIDERHNRIGIDTGAVRTGILSAIVIDQEQRRYMSTARR